MTSGLLNYVPVLKWRQGEYQALLRLKPDQKDAICPLLEITPPDFDFELNEPKHTIDAHLSEFAKRLEAKWGGRPAFLDVGLVDPGDRMIGGVHPLLWLMDETRLRSGSLIPVTGLEREDSHQNAVRISNQVDQRGVALRCGLEDASDGDFTSNVESLLEKIEVSLNDLDILIDLRSPNFEPIDGLVELLSSILLGSYIFDIARSITILATSFPASMAEVTPPIAFIRRREWELYKLLLASRPHGMRRLGFGDYAIASPELFQGDMRLIKPSATVRYATDDGWVIAKGPNVRDNGFGQYKDRCQSIFESGRYLGPQFSVGSDYVDKCRLGKVSTGSLTTWRWVGTNHHIAKVLHDLSILRGF